MREKKVISIVGAGGKTTLIHRKARKYCERGLRVLVTTSTKMLREEDTDISGNADVISARLDVNGYCMAGLVSENPDKICRLPEAALHKAMESADVTLIEADGARHYWAKYPSENEPVIIPDTELVILVMGLEAIGTRVSDSVFRYEYAIQAGLCSRDDTVTFELLERLVNRGYIESCCREYDTEILFTHIIDGELEYLTYDEARELYG